VAAVLALAIGIGFNTAIFSYVEALLLRPLPFPAAEQVVFIREHKKNYPPSSISAPDFLDWKAQSHSFQGMSAFVYTLYVLTGRDVPEALVGLGTDTDFFQVTGEKAELGRVYLPGSAGGEAVLSHGAWKRLFGMDVTVIGSTLTLNGEPVTVVGVLPEGFHYPSERDVWVSSRTKVPVERRETADVLNNREDHYFQAVGRLKPGVSLASAQAELKLIGHRLATLYPDSNSEEDWGFLQPVREQLVGKARAPLWLLMAAVGAVLLIACLNVASLQLASLAGRRHELAVRVALGATRWQLARQVLVEGLVLSALGGVSGILLAAWSNDVLAAWSRDSLPRLDPAGLDLRTLLFTLAVSLVSGVAFAVMPALAATRAHPMEALKAGGRTASGGTRRRAALVATEISVALVLLVGTAIVARSFLQLRGVKLGFDPHDVYVVRTVFGPPGTDDAGEARRAQAYESFLSQIATIPGVESTALVMDLPLSYSRSAGGIEVEGYKPAPDEGPHSDFEVVSPRYFQTMRIALSQGRTFDQTDRSGGRPVALINEAFRRRYLAGRESLGARIRKNGQEWLTVVGVVADTRKNNLQDEIGPELYRPVAQAPEPEVDLVIRSSSGIDSLLPSLKKAAQLALPDWGFRKVQPMAFFVDDFLRTERLLLQLTTLFSVVALGLALLGVYGVIAYTSQQRTREFGIRVALGAQPRDILTMVLTGAVRLTAAGLAIGLPLAVFAGRALRSQLYGAQAFDPLLLASISGLTLVTALAASFLPAWRATRLDPMVALRYE
jgi:putative ABC transport system permease protein